MGVWSVTIRHGDEVVWIATGLVESVASALSDELYLELPSELGSDYQFIDHDGYEFWENVSDYNDVWSVNTEWKLV